MIVLSFVFDDWDVACLLSDMQAKSELFCSQLHEQVLKLFPGYFEMMDRLPAGAEAPLESASERNIRKLFLGATPTS
jgi:hypothetical protein